MKNLNLKEFFGSTVLAFNPDGRTTVERRSNDGHIRRHLPVGLTKLLSLFLLLTLGTGQMWGDDCGFWSDGAAHIEFTVNGSTSKTQDLNASSISDLAMGTVTTSLTLKSAWAKVWGVDKFNSITLYYRVKVADASSSAAYSSANIPWGNNWDNNQYWANDNINATININLAPGNYEVEYYFMADAKNESDKYLSNGGSNYHANFTIPSKNLTVAGAANGNTVSGSKTGITKGTAYDITATPTTGYTFGGWSATNGSSSITIANSSSASTKVTFKNYSNNATVTASFNETMSAVTLSATPSGKGSFTIGGVAATSTSVGVTTTKSVTAVPISGYHFVSWAVSGGATISSTTANPVTVTGTGAGTAATLTATFEANDVHSLTVAKETGISSVTGSTSPVTLGTKYPISATVATGYNFDGWTASPTANGTFDNASSTSTNVTVKNGSVTVTASATENMSTLTTSNSYDVGNPNYAVPTKSASSIGIATTATLTAKAAGTGYTFAGWTLSNNLVVTGGNAATDRTITVRTNGDGAAATAQANYTEDLTTTWYINGDANGTSPFSGWGTSGTPMLKKTGHSTEEIYYCTIHVGTTATSDGFGFKAYNSAGADDAHRYYAYSDREFTKAQNSCTLYTNNNANNMKFKPYLTGDYEFKLDNTGTNPILTVTWPEINQVRISAANPANAANVGNFDMGAAVSNVRTVTRSLAANTTYTFKVVYNSDWYGFTSGEFTRSNSTSSNSLTVSTSGGDMKLKTDYAGDYTFNFNQSTKALSVTYPTAYTVTFGYGTGGSAVTATVEDATTITSGQYAAAGKDITFTQIPAAGYTFKGWYNAASGGSAIVSMASDNVYDDIAGNANIYAQYTEDTYTVTLVADGAFGTAHVTGGAATSGSAGIATSLAITAEPVSGNRFIRWTQTGGTGTAVIANDRSASTTVTVTGGDVTLTAEMGSNWVIGGGGDKFGNWNMADGHSFGNFEDNIGYVDIELPANTTYEVKVYDHGNSSWWGYTKEGMKTVDYTHNRGTALTFGMGDAYKNLQIITAGHGTYRFTWNVTEKQLTVTYPTSYTVTYNTLTWKGTNGEVKETSTTGGSLTSVVDNDDHAFTSGKYVVATGSVTFTASPASNYHFDGWYSDAACTTAYVNGEGGATIGENTLTLSSFTADKTAYAKFAENMTTVTLEHNGNGHVEISGVPVTSTTAGVVTTRSITAVPDAGYYFSGWTVEPAEGADYRVSGTGETNTTITLRGRGAGETTGQTLTANFVELDKIYFRNENEETGGKLWNVSKMYVYYNVGWANDGEFAGVNNLGTNAEMNPISAESNIYWAYVPRSFTTSGNRNVAFSDKWMGTEDYPGGTYTKFHNDNAVYRTDYNKNLNMYVPEHTEKYTSNSTKYFDNGYWMKYNTVTNQDAGYYLKEGNKDNQVDIFKATGNNSTTLIATYRFENTSNHTFFIANAAGKFYKASATITNAACTNVTIVEDAATPVGFTITPTSEGYYTLYIEQSGEKMKLSVVYPISAGDYRLDYTHDTDKHLYSDVFKPDNVSSTNVKKSVYIDPTTTGGSLKLQKCSGLDGSANPIWTSGRDIALSNFTDGKGVYEFDMTITDGTAVDADVASVALSNVKIYEGPFYIKTDYAPGHWVNYKENVLNKNTINFDAANSKSYNYYHCAWVGEGDMNVKCIIANEYNEQITDTLKTDDIVTGTPEVLPATANVRFSYNSVTNTLKRTYLNGSANWQDRYLLLAGDAKIRSLKTHAAYTGNDTTMVDNNNWTYVLDLEAQGGAKVKLSANYHNTTQWLIGDASHTVQILGGTDTGWASLRIVYDFKTNHLLSAWLVPASGNTPAKTLNTSVMVLRENQNDAHEITFEKESDALLEVDTVYSALHFTYDYLTNQTKTVHERTFYWISFPYDVKVSDIFGSVGNYMEEWGILYYDGKQRAKNGMWIDSPSCWKYMAADDTLHAFEGYVAEIDLALIGTERNKGRWINNVTDLCLYFPSNGKVNTIVSKDITISIDQTDYQCKIDRTGNNGSDFNKNRTIADSYWHCLGVPSFAKNTHSTSDDWTGNYPTLTNWETEHMPYVYEYDGTTNSYNVVSATNYEFKPMRSYLTQFNATSLTWSSVTAPATPSSVAARRAPQGAETDTEFRLTLMQDAQEVDRTFVRLCDDENVTAGFEFNYDLCKEMKTGANVYTIVSNYLPVAGNCLPMNNQTTVVPMGVQIAADGEYTFAMPEGTNGTGVTLIDNETGTRTSLALMDYTVTLGKGTYDNRFVLEFSPVAQTPTGIEDAEIVNRKSSNRKLLIDGILYIVKDGQVFDARGTKVK